MYGVRGSRSGAIEPVATSLFCSVLFCFFSHSELSGDISCCASNTILDPEVAQSLETTGLFGVYSIEAMLTVQDVRLTSPGAS